MATINLTGKDKAKVLIALYNNAKPIGRGEQQYNPQPLSMEEAMLILQDGMDFDYLRGRVLKVNLSGNTFDTWGYDRDNGEGSAERALKNI